MINFLKFAFCILLAFDFVGVQASVWKPSSGPTQIPIWPGSAPNSQPIAKPEEMKIINDPLVAGKPWTMVGPVAQPTMTVYSPRVKNTGEAHEISDNSMAAAGGNVVSYYRDDS